MLNLINKETKKNHSKVTIYVARNQKQSDLFYVYKHYPFFYYHNFLTILYFLTCHYRSP